MLSKVLNTTSIPKPSKFSDISTSWASSAINTLTDIGIVNGASNESFKPKANATRSESLMMILRMLNISLGLSLEIE
ncbi:S-layer homology domain-containing protein [Paenibacillus psychroresistens]|uniref:S-layer homology domain-containing protein n=2 Tax=Paenibacillus psychroresistens TaxID=1778678 RepID=A0A6B8RY75_9BACL|nr:S-layer homology domain-containing protein [Paenibacillus psychroresistens]